MNLQTASPWLLLLALMLDMLRQRLHRQRKAAISSDLKSTGYKLKTKSFPSIQFFHPTSPIRSRSTNCIRPTYSSVEHMHTYTHVRIHTRMHTCTYMHTYRYTHTFMHLYIHGVTRIYTRTVVHTYRGYTRTHTYHRHTHNRINIHAHIYTYTHFINVHTCTHIKYLYAYVKAWAK